MIGLFHPTWTPKISSDGSISELRKVEINNTSLEIMIRGKNRDNPVVLFVHGGPCCSEIPYVRKYGFAARNIDEDADYIKGFLFGSEYNLLDAVRFYTANGYIRGFSALSAV